MKLFFNYLKQYIRSHFNLKLYGTFAIFLTILITLNYTFDIERSIHRSLKWTIFYPLAFFAVNTTVYYIACLLQSRFTHNSSFLFNRKFWTISLIGFVILSIDLSFYVSRDICSIIPVEICKYVREVMDNLTGAVTLILPLFIIYKTLDHKHQNSFYGFTIQQVPWKSYLMVVPILAIIIFIGSFSSGLLEYYPIYKRSGAEGFTAFFQIPEWITVLIYELAYGFDFLRIELFFRGFLVLGMIRFLGKDAILPMVATYVALHFSKPMEEAISSAFGGYILGVISYYTKNLWGGVIWHVSIAWFMEGFAFLQMVMD